MMFGVLNILTISSAWAQDYTKPQEDSKSIGVWRFSVESNAHEFEQVQLQATLEERTREAILPLIQQHSELNLITPENLQIEGQLPTSNRILETSRALELDYVVVGKVYEGRKVECILKLYHVETGSLLEQVSLSVDTSNTLTRELPPLIDDLLVPILQRNNQNAKNIIDNFSAKLLRV